MTGDSSKISSEIDSVPLLPGQWKLLLVVITASFTNVSLIFFFISALTMISEWEWANNLLWPNEIYLAGFVGGILGGILAFFEIKNFFERKRELKPGTLIASDLLFITAVLSLVYLLDILSESSLLQGLFFVIVVLWFTVFAQNVIKIIWQEYGFRSDASLE